MTFSIVAYDGQDWGVAVASKFLAAAAVVSWAQAGAGAVATQALARVPNGLEGLALMAEGKSAQHALETLLAADPQRARRQVGLVDAQGGVAAHTGAECHEWAGHVLGEGFACQGNILTGQNVVGAMADAFRAAKGELADRLVVALMAGEAAGGDKRGKQSAGVLVVRTNGGYGGDNDRYLDLRVDDDENPMKKLKQMVDIHHLYFSAPKPEDQLTITPEIAAELQSILLKEGYFGGDANGQWDEMSKQAFWALVGNENLEERWNIETNPDRIDRVALDYLRARYK
ncbi:MAG: DUF1028 domain-containing protein [Anaerolineae bacterium]